MSYEDEVKQYGASQDYQTNVFVGLARGQQACEAR